ncbi:type II toxin-antitoxin system mRNA interferase toxin, RelE/StbE family [Candidatus Kaiserbacteria bacterium]|nr:type II toxin-antitoxin system mRNA interferase toxin, RelE/StbE family [Candidatus Kaiserbacteria bacterium]
MQAITIRPTGLFEKQYRKLPKKIKEFAKQKEVAFRENPFHPSLDTHKLHGKDKDVWAFSINHKYRIKFVFLNTTTALFLEIGLHDIYR